MDYKSFQPGGQEQKPVTPPVIQMSSKTFTPKFIWVVVALLVLGGSAYAGLWFWNDKNKEAVAPIYTPRPDPMADWKTYRNDQYGFEFRYSADKMTVKEIKDREGVVEVWDNESLKLLGTGDAYPGIFIDFKSGKANIDQSWLSTSQGFSLYKLQSQKETLGGREAFVAKGEEIMSGQKAFIFPLEQGVLIVDTIESTPFIQILSTFKFISPLINSFQSCADAGYPIMESYPEKCRTPDGLTFTKYDACIQVIARARNPQTGETRDFPTPCDVPEGWEPVNS